MNKGLEIYASDNEVNDTLSVDSDLETDPDFSEENGKSADKPGPLFLKIQFHFNRNTG